MAGASNGLCEGGKAKCDVERKLWDLLTHGPSDKRTTLNKRPF